MKKNILLYLLLIAMAILVLVIKNCKTRTENKPVTNTTDTRKKKQSSADRERGFDRRISYLQYSNHATCRMECRQISISEVEEIMQNGTINYNKSDIKNARCPRYALEGITSDNQRVRIVFAQCNEKTEVVTVIDLKTDWSCACPGDDKKFENRN